MALEANFTSVSSYDFKTLHIVDMSTPNYGGEIIEGRKIIVCDAAGNQEEFDFPIVDGVGDVFDYPMVRDQALVVELRLYPLLELEESTYVRIKNLLLANRLLEGISCQRKQILHLCDDNCAYLKELETVEVASGLFDTARYLISSDVFGAQEALDKGNDLCSIKANKPCQ